MTSPSLDDTIIRAARDADSGAVIRLIARVFAEYPGCLLDVDGEEPELRNPATSFERFWVAERCAEIVGCCACSRAPDRLELKKCYVARSERGRGTGRRLIAMVEAHARRLGLRKIELWTDTRFDTAHAVYRHLGYRATGRRRELGDISGTTELHFVKELST